ncbi:hypothetical protein NLX83_20795 [Allokutzneria sp. A3M-2-11 16]|uniref:LppM family (lipo)protein n=1 Tax=Allokutzneria sp. A3M-2-11 16 TaxID=2962043 RepID=UPI0020B75BF6|nr:hypothetical protein [Allokutzneria sp. A3M-2-11 16]MCP3801705.1 hypothetical protein [Allokutzneria sp. A3M-2-11 16]
MRRATALIGLFLFAVLALSGCTRYRATAVLGVDDTVSGSVIVAYSPEGLGMAQGSGRDVVAELKEFLERNATKVSRGSATVRPYTADGHKGYETVFSGVSTSDFLSLLRYEEGGQGVDFSLTRTPEGYAFSAKEQPDKPGQIRIPAEAVASVEIAFSITFPGPVLRANGEVSGSTVTWRPKLRQSMTLEAVGAATAPPAPSVADPPGSTPDDTSAPESGGLPIGIIIGALCGLLIAAAAVVLILRRFRN